MSHANVGHAGTLKLFIIGAPGTLKLFIIGSVG